jgi:predicted RNA-binding protein with PIN domain
LKGERGISYPAETAGLSAFRVETAGQIGHRAGTARLYNFGMAILIDGYNLLHVTGIYGKPGPGTELHRTRYALLDFLAAAMSDRERGETTIVFDAAGAPPGLPRSLVHDGITVHFARGQAGADEMIEDLLEQCVAPRSLTVVSSDHRVQRAARHRGADFVDSDVWYAELLTVQRQQDQAAADGKPHADTREDAQYWISQFGGATQADEPESPFPPGYGEDLIED